MVMGTASGVGKSLIVTALCRAFAQQGIRVAPFKSQNMSNNAAVCAGGEIGRAQAVQTEACGIEPGVDMNPVLLKPEGGRGCQVVIHGRARFWAGIDDYDRYRREAWPAITQSYHRLASYYDLIVIEGAGSAAEINFRDRDLANWAVAEMAQAPVLIVGDIDKGGVFAALIGTTTLLSLDERRRIGGLIINKFRGDPLLLRDGIELLRDRAGTPVLGVLPYLTGLTVPDEDSAALAPPSAGLAPTPLRAAVVHLPHISNYTDFAPLEAEPEISLGYFTDPAATPEVDVLFLPGSKSTIADLTWLREAGWETYLARHRARGGFIAGICGGYQMLGRRIRDPDGVESRVPEAIGLGLLEVQTLFAREKVTARVSGCELSSHLPIEGYEIHAGRIAGPDAHPGPFQITERDERVVNEREGAQTADRRVMGSSIHGLFDAADYRRAFLNRLRSARGLLPVADAGPDAPQMRARSYDRLADAVRAHLDFAAIMRLAGLR